MELKLSMTNITIRCFTIEDYQQVFTLWQATEGMGLSGADSEENIRQYLQRNPGMSFVALDGDRIIGAVLCGHDGRRGLLHHLAVDKSYQRRGIGKILAEKCQVALNAEGIEKCHLFVYTDNIEAQMFWENIGWELRKDIVIMSRVIR
jgi:ribosomal protein S18 acetylase RimI-like enzyme